MQHAEGTECSRIGGITFWARFAALGTELRDTGLALVFWGLRQIIGWIISLSILPPSCCLTRTNTAQGEEQDRLIAVFPPRKVMHGAYIPLVVGLPKLLTKLCLETVLCTGNYLQWKFKSSYFQWNNLGFPHFCCYYHGKSSPDLGELYVTEMFVSTAVFYCSIIRNIFLKIHPFLLFTSPLSS